MPTPIARSNREWNLYRAFLALAYAKSVDAAADELGISTATLRRRLDRLKTMLGHDLYSGSGKTFRLTARGLEIFGLIRGVDESLATVLDRRNSPVSVEPQASFCISTSDVWMRRFWMPVLRKEMDKLENIDLCFGNADFSIGSQDLVQDLVLSPRPVLSSVFASIAVGTPKVVLCVHKSYIERYGPVTRENFDQHRFIQILFIRSYPNATDLMADIASQCKEVISVETVEQALQVCEAGVGFVTTIDWLVTDSCQVIGEPLDFEVPFYLTYRKSLLKNSATSDLLERIVARAKATFGGQGADQSKSSPVGQLAARDTHMAAHSGAGVSSDEKVMPFGFSGDR